MRARDCEHIALAPAHLCTKGGSSLAQASPMAWPSPLCGHGTTDTSVFRNVCLHRASIIVIAPTAVANRGNSARYACQRRSSREPTNSQVKLAAALVRRRSSRRPDGRAAHGSIEPHSGDRLETTGTRVRSSNTSLAPKVAPITMQHRCHRATPTLTELPDLQPHASVHHTPTRKRTIALSSARQMSARPYI